MLGERQAPLETDPILVDDELWLPDGELSNPHQAELGKETQGAVPDVPQMEEELH